MKNIEKFNDHKDSLNENWFRDNWNRAVQSIKRKTKGWHNFIEYLEEKGQMPKGVTVVFADGKTFGAPVNPNHVTGDRNDDFVPLVDESLINEGADDVTLDNPNKNMINANLAEISQAINDIYNARMRKGTLQALFIWGAPGIGKTEAIVQAAKRKDLDTIIFHLSQIEPSDFKGIPYLVKGKNKKGKETNRSDFALPLIFPTDEDGDKKGYNEKGGILFFDELNQANPMVLSASLPLMLEGGYNGYDMPLNWIAVAAGNRKIDTNVTPLGTPLSGRFAHVNLTPTVDEWAKYAYPNKNVDSRLVNFFRAEPQYFFKMNRKQDQNGPYASPRNWTKASYMVYDMRGDKFDYNGHNNKSEDRVWFWYEASVGKEAADAFKKYLLVISNISEKEIEDVYKKGAMPKVFDKITAISDPGLYQKLLQAIAGAKGGIDETAITIEEFKNFFIFAEKFKNHDDTTLVLNNFSAAHGKTATTSNWFVKNPKYAKIFMPIAKKWFVELEKKKKEMNEI